jgi:hypothetical protein
MKKHLLILATALLSISTFAQTPNYVPANGLVGWWPFNGNANDESGNGNHGNLQNPILNIDRFQIPNKAIQITNGLDIVCTSNQLNSPSIFSISLWFKANSHGRIFGFSDGQCIHIFNQDRYIDIMPDGKIRLHINNQQGNFFVYSPNSYLDSSWHHVIFKFDFAGTALFVDGQYQGSDSNNFFSTYNGYWRVGGLDSTSPSFLGSIDDIGIWNRALTACEIQDLYHAQLGSQAISAGADQSICSGDPVTLNGSGGSSYQWNNNVVDGQAFTPNQSANYVLNGTDSLGCQGIDTVVVIVLENAVSTLTQTALDSYTLNGQTYTQSGTYTQTVPAANGCDSTITLNLTLNFTGIDELGTGAKKLVKITDLNGKAMSRRKNTLMLFIYEDGTVERVLEMEE